MNAAMKTMRRVGTELIEERKKLFMDEKGALIGASDGEHYKDLLSALLGANLDPSIPESQRMNDEDVLSREYQVRCVMCISLIYVSSISRNTNFPGCRA